MNATKRRVLVAGLILAAAAGALGASAASDDGGFSVMPTAAPLPSDTDETADYRIGIASPGDGATVFNSRGDVFVSTRVEPPLAGGDQVELLVDGEPAAAPGTTLEFPLSGVPSGEHVLQARIIDSSGNVGSVSPSNILYMLDTHPPRDSKP